MSAQPSRWPELVRGAAAAAKEPFTKADIGAIVGAQTGSAEQSVHRELRALVDAGELAQEIAKGEGKQASRVAYYRRTAKFAIAQDAQPAPEISVQMRMRDEGIAYLQSIALGWGARRNVIRASEDHATV